MSPNVSPRGPLPARIYWVRRLVVLGVPLLLVLVLARILGGSADGKDPEQALQAGAGTGPSVSAPAVGPTAPTPKATKGKKGKGKKRKKVEPVLAEPSGPCSDADIVATPTLVAAPGGSDIPITIDLRTVVSEACTWQVSPETLTLTITSGTDDIWSSRECSTSIPVQDVVVRQAVDTPVVVNWHARRSDETCSKLTKWARLGFYHVQAAALGGEATDVQFELVRPTAPVITKTVTPKPDKGKNKGAMGKGKRGR